MLHTQSEAELFPPPSPQRASFADRPCVSGVWGLSVPEHWLHWSREKSALRLQSALYNRGDGATQSKHPKGLLGSTAQEASICYLQFHV